MPKCGKPKKDGTACTLNAMVGKDHCHLHPTIGKIEVMTDPVADLMAEVVRLRKEQDYLTSRLQRMEDERDEIIEGTTDQLARDRHGLSKEDLQNAQAAARLDFARRRELKKQELAEFNRQLREENRLSYTPTRSQMIPLGGKNWNFIAGKQGRYPRCVIQQFEEKCFKLDERDRAKAQLTIGPDDLGREFGQQQALLEANR